MYKKLLIYTDGGSRGNPGESAIGVYITDEAGKEVFSLGKTIGHATNNIAEYSAVLAAMTWLLENKDLFEKETEIQFFMDSNLLYSQLVGLYKIKNLVLLEFIRKIHAKRNNLGITVSFAHIPREKNKKADKLVNMALDNLL